MDPFILDILVMLVICYGSILLAKQIFSTGPRWRMALSAGAFAIIGITIWHMVQGR